MYLFLVGPPGIGKSTVAPLLAELLGAGACDLDALVARKAGMTAEEVIVRKGMHRFRDLESAALTALPATPAWLVVATGGGSVLRPHNRQRMRELGLILALKGSVATVARGLSATMAKRAHLTATPREHAAQVLRERSSAYADADVQFAVDGASPQEIARGIAAWLVGIRGARVDVNASSPYSVLIRDGLLSDVGPTLAALGWKGKVAVVRDASVARLYAPTVTRSLKHAGLKPTEIEIARGERAKGIGALKRLWSDLGAAGIGRDGGVVAVGGGACGDLAGFAAATYLRGIPVAQVPTTLLAMVDSSIGGKTGIDLPAGKNLAGAFHQPAAVLADPEVLASLPARQMSSGLAEVVKHAFLMDRSSVAQVAGSLLRIRDGDPGPTLATIAFNAAVKGSVVSEDEREQGLREMLNFGHTIGHAYEAASEYRATHGEAVAIGMVFEAALAEELGLASPTLRSELENLLVLAGLPVRARIPARAWGFLAQDKKVRAGKVRWILPRRIGLFSEVTNVGAAALRRAADAVGGRA